MNLQGLWSPAAPWPPSGAGEAINTFVLQLLLYHSEIASNALRNSESSFLWTSSLLQTVIVPLKEGNRLMDEGGMSFKHTQRDTARGDNTNTIALKYTFTQTQQIKHWVV